jgi:hypothetical protein
MSRARPSIAAAADYRDVGVFHALHLLQLPISFPAQTILPQRGFLANHQNGKFWPRARSGGGNPSESFAGVPRWCEVP